MKPSFAFVCIVGCALWLCAELASQTGALEKDGDWPRHLPVNLRREFAEADFDKARLVVSAALDTLSRQESESGVVPKEGWARLHAYLADFQQRHPGFVSKSLSEDLLLAEMQSH